MGIHADWSAIASQQRSPEDQQTFWNGYFELEQGVYEKLLARKEPYEGKLSALAQELELEPVVLAGFIDGINTSLAAGEYDLESLTEDSDISLAVDYEKLYYNMLDAKADWLYSLPQWEGILTVDQRKDITKRYRADKVFIAQAKVGRNEPCPCGSGKKYKQCCAKAL